MNTLTSSLRRWLLPSLLVVGAFVLAAEARAAEVIPQAPTRYFNDYALTVKPETADRLNRELEDFERQTSNQLRVAIYPKMQSDSDVADYCQRVARAWKVGETGKRNGAVLFVFIQDHKTNIQVGYGLEGALPDATCKDILSDKVKPLFKAGDYDGGLTAGVEAMIAATKGEYKGSGRTHYEDENKGSGGQVAGGSSWLTALFFLLVVGYLLWSSFRRQFATPGGAGRGAMYTGGGPIFFPGGGFGGGSSDGGGFGGGSSSSSSDGGGFASSGGGDFGGGGASGDW